ncbi:exodeoxyribonuclease VII small subunit [Hyalangium rubrum]|uniref:Exodeoxyribonuclease VII small subunit n=1 Tax=Hyalangium rubrum TaxID=3103134 RepID=A0ABU5HGM9_9BACT|nr:exodeoxyribonuclease VII small subunit [Hyalangium sp. s54d21]MDY7232611.1 exodeoxyribonuclease VII small subunit [Hyalangium sp. s54d21]
MAKPKHSTKKAHGRDMAKQKRSTSEPSYGEAAARLEEILREIEEDRVDVDDLSGLVKEAAELVTLCRGKIQAAEMQVQTIAEQLEREAPDTETDEDNAE